MADPENEASKLAYRDEERRIAIGNSNLRQLVMEFMKEASQVNLKPEEYKTYTEDALLELYRWLGNKVSAVQTLRNKRSSQYGRRINDYEAEALRARVEQDLEDAQRDTRTGR